VILEVTRLDDTATKHEVRETITRELGQGFKIELDIVLSLRETYGGTQTAVLKLPVEVSQKAPEEGYNTHQLVQLCA